MLLRSPSVGTFEQAITSFFGDYAGCVDPSTCQIYADDKLVEGSSVVHDSGSFLFRSGDFDSTGTSKLKCIGERATYVSGALRLQGDSKSSDLLSKDGH